MRGQFSQLLYEMKFIASPDPKDSNSNQNSGENLFYSVCILAAKDFLSERYWVSYSVQV